MEALKSYYDDVEESYEEFVFSASKAASYATEHSEIKYEGELDTANLSLPDSVAYEFLEEELVEAQNLSLEVYDSINRLSKEMKLNREQRDGLSDEYYDLGDRLSRIRDQFHTLDRETTELMKQADRTERPELEKHRSIIGNQEAKRLAGQIPFEPKR